MVLGLLGSLGSGCLRWDAVARTPPLTSVSSGLKVAGAPAVVVMKPFVDDRGQRGQCGMKKYKEPTAKVLCESPPNIWLAELLAQDLRAAGFTVHADPVPSGPDELRIEGVLTQFFVEPDVENYYQYTWLHTQHRPEADIGVTLTAKRRGLAAERRFYVKGLGLDENGYDSNYQRAVDDGVRKALGEMVRAIIDLVERGAQPGASPCAPAGTEPVAG